MFSITHIVFKIILIMRFLPFYRKDVGKELFWFLTSEEKEIWKLELLFTEQIYASQSYKELSSRCRVQNNGFEVYERQHKVYKLTIPNLTFDNYEPVHQRRTFKDSRNNLFQVFTGNSKPGLVFLYPPSDTSKA